MKNENYPGVVGRESGGVRLAMIVSMIVVAACLVAKVALGI